MNCIRSWDIHVLTGGSHFTRVWPLTDWGVDNMVDFFQNGVSLALYWMLVFVFWFKFNRLLLAIEFNQISHSWTSELFISWYSKRVYIIFDIIDIIPDPLYYCINIRSQNHAFTVYPKKYAHGFCFAVLCCGHTLTDFPISIRLTSLALWQSNDCPSASKATLMNMD